MDAQLLKLREQAKKNLPKLDDKLTRMNANQVIRWQTNDELIENIQRLQIQEEFIAEYVRAICPPFEPISVRQVFDLNERAAKGIAMTMMYVALIQCHGAVDLCRMSKSTMRMKDWDPKKFIFDARGGRHIARMVYDVRIKKHF